jgi:PUA domain protein
MSEKYSRHFLKAKEAKALLDMIPEKPKAILEQILKAKTGIEVIKTNFAEFLLVNSKPVLVRTGKNVFPTLVFSEFIASAPKIVVDMGAIPHVCSGADVMAPGIVHFEGEFKSGELVVIVDEKHHKPIAIGEAACDSDTAKNVAKGVIVKNIHFVGDKTWNFIRKLET